MGLAKPTETALVRQLLNYLALRKIMAWRQNTSGLRRRDRNGREFWSPPGLRGISDIIGVLPGGRFLAIEAKVGWNRCTEEQDNFLCAVSRAGGLALVCRSLETLERALELEGVPE